MTDRNVSRSSEPTATSLSLLHGARALDNRSWARLIDKYTDRLLHQCKMAGLQKSDSSDIVQEVFSSVARRIGTFRKEQEGDSFRGWLKTIADNKIRDHWRRQRLREYGRGGSSWHLQIHKISNDGPVEESDVSFMPDRSVELDQAKRQEVEQLRSYVSDRDWEILKRLVVDEVPAADVAEEFGISPNAVYLTRARTLRRLRKKIPKNASTTLQ